MGYRGRVKSSVRTTTRWAALAALPLGAVLLAGCGGGGSGDTAKDPAPPATGTTGTAAAFPACHDVWKAGATIPAGYKGCADGSEVVKAHARQCESGQQLVTYGGTYYGAIGGPVNVVPSGLQSSSNYRSAVKACD